MKRSINEVYRYLKTKKCTHGTAIQFIDGILPVILGIKTSYLVDCIILDQLFIQSFLDFLSYPSVRAIYFSEPINQTFFINIGCWKEYVKRRELWPIVVNLPHKVRNEQLEQHLTLYADTLLHLKTNQNMITVQVPDFTWNFKNPPVDSNLEEVCSITALTGCLLNYAATYHFLSNHESHENGLSKEPLNIYRIVAVFDKCNIYLAPFLQFSCPIKFEQQTAMIVEQLTCTYQKRWNRLTVKEKSIWKEWIKFRFPKHALGNVENISWKTHVEIHTEPSVVL
ncbi:hypothetical protein SPOG_04508 [Schizosaccharomyces cryophilus OY26]|uniref:Uncharacterized protein n=1 Tax=Schizosaccharomyces cryophilus (strain OY26 / ATCC MYA-4695 / CBS 11777 / NBRC 106824 / NRRL Y48691) TaxID=653667 RepID=S9W6M5_SCHCR|nr:uncharacterized protein SPOG_04508 [Schizosaccharomyces cryophilus OY26]EPY53490.1 hypothetical protein SPOG_04508 [Schizosaccharomyces cryophilus OY26]